MANTRRTHYAEGLTANELVVQFLFSIGAHGAHAFWMDFQYSVVRFPCLFG